MKRRPEKERPKNEYTMYFRLTDEQNQAQIILRRNGVKYRVSGLNLIIPNWDIPTYRKVYALVYP